MTPKQEERLRNKIKKFKAALAADKKFWGGFYHDGQGLRYAIPQMYIQLGDFSGGLRYMNWFQKNFSDDAAYSIFFFEWALILYKTKRNKEAEQKVVEAFVDNRYIFDKFFDRLVMAGNEENNQELKIAEKHFNYSHTQENFSDFASWLDSLLQSEKFVSLVKEYEDRF